MEAPRDDPDRDHVIAQLGPAWAAMCRANASTTFLWAHNGKTKNGWVQLLPNGKLSTTWCLGTWAVLANNTDVVDMSFGSSQHLCHLKKDGTFVVEQKYGLRTGKDSYKLGATKTCGFISRNDQRGYQGVPGEKGYKPLGGFGKRKDLDDDDPEARTSSFAQKELQFGAFFAAWSDWKAKKARCLKEAAWERPTPEVPKASEPVESAAEAALAEVPKASEPVESAAEAALAEAEAAAVSRELEAEAAELQAEVEEAIGTRELQAEAEELLAEAALAPPTHRISGKRTPMPTPPPPTPGPDD
eukprot:TRINITY_DN5293_c0_g1_i1.p1 TRINITY_DN5293_c0_g1~~TRINITY_DN5293_c0_g1_i1.p1  ORF type:complete len:301 (-),score=74.13 TRINITY_DN5293_c0_g1_i1:267-1169(-)